MSYNNSGIFETDDEVSTEALKRYLEISQIHLNEGQVCEVNLAAAEWLWHVSEKIT